MKRVTGMLHLLVQKRLLNLKGRRTGLLVAPAPTVDALAGTAQVIANRRGSGRSTEQRPYLSGGNSRGV